MTDSALIGGADQVPSPAPPPVPTDRAAILVAAGILLSRVSGIIREGRTLAVARRKQHRG